MDKNKSCNFAGFEYEHDYRICKTGRCMKCNDGKWEDTGKSCPCR
jgi:hypothetical protein